MSVNEDQLTKPKSSKKAPITIAEAVVLPTVVTPVTPEVVIVPTITAVPLKQSDSVSLETEVVVKVKKPRSQAQIDAFAKTAETRKLNIAKNKQLKDIEKAKAVLALMTPEPVAPVSVAPSQPSTPPDQKDEENMVSKTKKMMKKKAKYTIVVEDSDDDDSDDSESSEDEQPIKSPPRDPPSAPVKTERNFSSQQNKKSKITVHSSTPINYDKYFAD
jgi:hypothetical protein